MGKMGEKKGLSRPLVKSKANLKQKKGVITSRSILTGNYCGSIRVFACNLAVGAQKSFSAVARKLAAVLYCQRQNKTPAA